MSLLWYHAFLISRASANRPMCWCVKGRESVLEVMLRAEMKTCRNPHCKQLWRIPGNKHSNLPNAYHLSLHMWNGIWALVKVFWRVTQRSKANIGVRLSHKLNENSFLYSEFVWQAEVVWTITDGVTVPIRVKWHSSSVKWIIMWKSNLWLIF